MNVEIEFIGISRLLTNTSKVTLSIDEKTTYHDLVISLAKKFPSLVGQIIKAGSFEFYPSNMFSINGKRMVKPDEMDHLVQAGDHLVVMSILAGG